MGENLTPSPPKRKQRGRIPMAYDMDNRGGFWILKPEDGMQRYRQLLGRAQEIVGPPAKWEKAKSRLEDLLLEYGLILRYWKGFWRCQFALLPPEAFTEQRESAWEAFRAAAQELHQTTAAARIESRLRCSC